MTTVLINLIWATFFVVIAIIITAGCLAYSEDESIAERYCDTKKHLSDNKKEIELRRLDVLEKTPELRKLIFNPKTIENDNK